MRSNEDRWNMLLKLCADTAHAVNCFRHNLMVANNHLKYNIAESRITHHCLSAISMLTKQMVADSATVDKGVNGIRGALKEITSNTKDIKRLEKKYNQGIVKVRLDTERSRCHVETLVSQVNNMHKMVNIIVKTVRATGPGTTYTATRSTRAWKCH
ncbi:hypothetical protein BDM02DRAFT_3187369 [Thelephora ganbajun]|uniref:Uncharacterized protein n=1 Tax=Thelephora ganbajun TaxID=370292 RepID=A0ACB6ZF68_THEGA|nr:hypothetical protein BDM02DRAFT_3187369 [Thelephora ganbajun]